MRQAARCDHRRPPRWQPAGSHLLSSRGNALTCREAVRPGARALICRLPAGAPALLSEHCERLWLLPRAGCSRKWVSKCRCWSHVERLVNAWRATCVSGLAWGVFLAPDCPARGTASRAALRAVARDRLRRPETQRPLTRDSAPTRKTGDEQDSPSGCQSYSLRSAGCAVPGPRDRSLGFGACGEGGGRPGLAGTDKETVSSWSAVCPGRAGKMISRCPIRRRNR